MNRPCETLEKALDTAVMNFIIKSGMKRFEDGQKHAAITD